MYDALSADYDKFVNWPSRLAFEMPFIQGQIIKNARVERPIRVLDTACGTGMHVVALAERGYVVDGADLSVKMVEKAVINAQSANQNCLFKAAGFGELAEAFSDRLPYDAVLCLGNSLPHLLSRLEIGKALADFAACLTKGGSLLIQNRNFDAVMANRERWMEPQNHEEPNGEWIFLRFYDFTPDGLITFTIITLSRTRESGWRQQITQTQLYPILQNDLLSALEDAGFEEIVSFGGMDGQPFQAESSGNLIVSAIKT